jgi:hypothetical protein
MNEKEIESSLRIASEGDVPQLLSLCHQIHDEIGAHPWSESKVCSMIWRGVTRDRALFGVIGPPDDIKAMILLSVESVWYSDHEILLELLNFVREDSRKSNYADQLIEFGKRTSDELGIELHIGIMSHKRLAAKERLYGRHLLKAGTFFVHSAEKIAEAEAEKPSRQEALDKLSSIVFERLEWSPHHRPPFSEQTDEVKSRYRRTVKNILKQTDLTFMAG